MAINTHANFFAGLILIACGTGLLKPNISAMVGQLYPKTTSGEDAGFSIFIWGLISGLSSRQSWLAFWPSPIHFGM